VENFYAAADVVALPSVRGIRQRRVGEPRRRGAGSGQPAGGAAELLTGALAEGILDRLDDREELVGKLVRLMARCADPSLAAEARALARIFLGTTLSRIGSVALGSPQHRTPWKTSLTLFAVSWETR
jgi:hypothetical protein